MVVVCYEQSYGVTVVLMTIRNPMDHRCQWCFLNRVALLSLLLGDFPEPARPCANKPTDARTRFKRMSDTISRRSVDGRKKKNCARGPNWQPHEYLLAFNQEQFEKKTSGIYLMKTTFKVWVISVWVGDEVKNNIQEKTNAWSTEHINIETDTLCKFLGNNTDSDN